MAGTENAHATPETPGDPPDSDVGSPALLTPVGAPQAEDQTVQVNEGTVSVVITLVAPDPVPGPITPPIFSIVTGPDGVSPTTGSSGNLIDHNNGDIDVTGGGALATDEVTFVPAPGVTGIFAFTFKANDGQADSNTAAVTIWLQDEDRVVITEIMYDPDNQPEEDWEWIEITNRTGQAIDLHTLFDASRSTAGNLVGSSIPSNATMIIAKGDVTGGRSLAEFVTEWAPVNTSDAIVVAEADMPMLNQNGDTLMLLDTAGRLLDVVVYDDVGQDGWPVADGYSSIYLVGGSISTFDNDDPASWALSVQGVDGAYATPEDPGLPTDIDVGSPAILPPTTGCDAIVTSVASIKTHANGTWPITDANGADGWLVTDSRSATAQQIEITFSSDVGSLQGAVTAAGLTISNQTLSGDGMTLIMDVSGATDFNAYTINLGAALPDCPAGNEVIVVRQCWCNTSGDNAINNTDKSQVAQANGSTADANTAFMDVTLDGNINNSDKSATAALNGSACP